MYLPTYIFSSHLHNGKKCKGTVGVQVLSIGDCEESNKFFFLRYAAYGTYFCIHMNAFVAH